MRLIILLPCLIIFISPTYSQLILKLQPETKTLSDRTFNIIEVIDHRKDTMNIGLVHVGIRNKITVANLQGGIEKSIFNYINGSYGTVDNADSIVMVIKEFKIFENTSQTTSDYATFKAFYEFYQFQKGDFSLVFNTSHNMEQKYYAVKGKHVDNIKTSIDKALRELNASPREGKGLISYNEKTNEVGFPILYSDKLVKGIYKSLEEFLNNNPSVKNAFEVRRKAHSSRVWLGTVENKPYYLDENGKHVRIEEYVWGFCDGEKAYIHLDREYFELLIKKKAVHFFGYTSLSEKTNGFIGGVMGSLPLDELYRLDLKTGLVFKVN
jgi:hypothetical protein